VAAKQIENKVIIVLVTCASQREAQKIARALVENRLAACGNIIESHVESIYRWKGKINTACETLLILKTTRRQFAKLEEEIRKLHSYDVPEIIAMPVVAGSAQYLKWVAESVTAP
jgi:periplasmic divalent cation tolerance protein